MTKEKYKSNTYKSENIKSMFCLALKFNKNLDYWVFSG